MASSTGRGVAVVTGASSGIGAATARRLAAEGYEVVIGARRVAMLEELAGSIGARAIALDVTDDASVAAFCQTCRSIGPCEVLVANAGGALGLDPVVSADLDGWRTMFETNVLGTVRMIKELIGSLEEAAGHIVLMGSIAGLEPYPGGAGYHAAKYPIHALQQVLRMELLGKPIRVTEIDPGMIGGTEFSLVRFAGDEARAAAVYDGVVPAGPEDVADAVAWAVTRPKHVNIDQIVIKPLDQANARMYNR